MSATAFVSSVWSLRPAFGPVSRGSLLSPQAAKNSRHNRMLAAICHFVFVAIVVHFLPETHLPANLVNQPDEVPPRLYDHARNRGYRVGAVGHFLVVYLHSALLHKALGLLAVGGKARIDQQIEDA
jgi:hypothetical protein